MIAVQTGLDMAASFDHLRALARDVVGRATRPAR